MDDLVWYACYGSNLLEKRFKLYIQGGRSDLIDKTYTGCTDKTPPLKNKPYTLHHGLFFSQTSSIWENKGVAFIKSKEDKSVDTLSRIYLITRSQFEQVFLQENELDPNINSIELDLQEIQNEGQLILNNNWYGRIIYIGDEDGYPVLTFTSPLDDNEIQHEPPGEKYLTVIAKGIKECHDMSDNDIVNYLSNISGIKNFIDFQRLLSIIGS